jgi:hypothetical protein
MERCSTSSCGEGAKAGLGSLANVSSLANRRSLVVGYGNPLRSDDGIGWVIAGRLATDPRFAGTDVLQRHQLTPELALDISRAGLVVLVDARSGPPAPPCQSSEWILRSRPARPGPTWVPPASPLA